MKNCRKYSAFTIIVSVLFFLSCKHTNTVPANREQALEMVFIKGGKMCMGDGNMPDNSPVLEQEMDDFYMMKYEVTNLLFAEFAASAGYITTAEKKGGSYVFVQDGKSSGNSMKGAPWWHFTKNISWKSDIQNKDFYPATHISYTDACAFCEWFDMRLPTEAEWEYAAQKDGIKDAEQQNIWQGIFPLENKMEDGFEGTSPAGSFPAGKAGLHDMNGNVWEWCADLYHARWYFIAQEFSIEKRKAGPGRSYDPQQPFTSTFVIRGGSFLCAENYCTGYSPFTRMRSDTSQTFAHIGFRCVKDKK